MWRGGLSGPNSLYIHADRPLISENATSTLLHEVMHSVLRQSAASGYDWIVEGVAEYYSLELLRRSGSISEPRYRKALEMQHEWAKSADSLCRRSSKAETTALAVTVLRDLDAELRENSAGDASLDDFLQALQEESRDITLETVQKIAASLAGRSSDVLQLDNLPGCRSIQSDSQEPQ
jgi:predicted metalloprotease with PDZ domain